MIAATVFFYLLGAGIALVHAVPAMRPLYAYKGRHRTGHQPTPIDNWAEAFEVRIAAERTALIAALKGPTQELTIPYVDSDIKPYEHSNGTGAYVHLRPDEMDAADGWNQLLAGKGLALRSPWMTPEEREEELIGSAT
jgi:hypothetical protein